MTDSSILAPADGMTQDDAAFPWPPAEDASIPAAFIRTWTESLLRPTAFFRSLPVPGPIGGAFLYYLAIGIIVAAIDFAWRLGFTIIGLSAVGAFPLLHELDLRFDFASPLLSFLFAPLGLLIGIGIAFPVIHVGLVISGGARRGAGTTFRTLCYAYSPALLGIIPVFGRLVGAVWMIVTAIIGLREAHRTDGWRAAFAVLAPIAIVFALGALLVFLGAILAIGASVVGT